MTQPCRKVFLLLAISTLSCRGATSPPAINAEFFLTDVNGQTLPAPLPGATGSNSTVLSSALTLYVGAMAQITERRRDGSGVETSFTSNYTYKIVGNQIEFKVICIGPVLCVSPPSGTLNDGTLAVDFSGGSGQVVYNYQRGVRID